jgi:hypothetical protein
MVYSSIKARFFSIAYHKERAYLVRLPCAFSIIQSFAVRLNNSFVNVPGVASIPDPVGSQAGLAIGVAVSSDK